MQHLLPVAAHPLRWSWQSPEKIDATSPVKYLRRPPKQQTLAAQLVEPCSKVIRHL
jgi:hypothetical protein